MTNITNITEGLVYFVDLDREYEVTVTATGEFAYEVNPTNYSLTVTSMPSLTLTKVEVLHGSMPEYWSEEDWIDDYPEGYYEITDEQFEEMLPDLLKFVLYEYLKAMDYVDNLRSDLQ